MTKTRARAARAAAAAGVALVLIALVYFVGRAIVRAGQNAAVSPAGVVASADQSRPGGDVAARMEGQAAAVDVSAAMDPNVPPELARLDMRVRPTGRTRLAAAEAMRRGDVELAEELWLTVLTGEGPMVDRFGAALTLAQLYKSRGEGAAAERLLGDVLSEFRGAASGMSSRAPLDRIAAEAAKDCADLLGALRAEHLDLSAAYLSRDLVLDHREFFAAQTVVDAILSKSREFERSGDRKAVLATLEEAVALGAPEKLSPQVRTSLLLRYGAELSRSGRAGEGVAIHETLWADPGIPADSRIQVGLSLIESLNDAGMHDRRVDLSWEIIGTIEAALADARTTAFDRRSLTHSRSSILHTLTTSDAYGRPVDAMEAIARLLVETADADERASLELAREGIEMNLAASARSVR